MTGRQTDVNFYLEMINGSGAILLAIVLAFFTMYLVEQRRFRKLSWRETFFKPPPGVALLMPMMAIKVGLLLSRGSLWIWRQFGNGGHMPAWQMDLTLAGTAITSIGLLWLLRVISRARFGEWPWIASASVVLIYVVFNSLGFIP
ncbi:hypothetical protein [Bradyrhizobium sp. 150]|uniref:hypothetical protein n=1 Tax=Bradyrhizobium sp. 150 TaxID=2782625 RepID=UPI001FF7FC1F|nr:hypothetical protein [Bradyrhizobium sp. 150]MCK1670325.1 hypothetical protein [Bradyrhizobium sp. 150]